MELIDFNNSYITWLTKGQSYGRFAIDSLMKFENKTAQETFYLGSTVMACDVYGKGQLFRHPPYSFTPIFSHNQIKRFRFSTPEDSQSDDIKFHSEIFEKVSFNISYTLSTKLNSIDDIINESKKNSNLIGKVEIVSTNNEDTSLIFPIKHINYTCESPYKFQVETGPVIYIPENKTKKLANTSISYISFNNFSEIHILSSANKNTFGYFTDESKIEARIGVFKV